MERNLGKWERWARLALGVVACLGASFMGLDSIGGGLLGIVGVCLLANALLARCYLWRWLGINGRSGGRQCGMGPSQR